MCLRKQLEIHLLPSRKTLENAILKALVESDGKEETKKIYPKVIAQFPKITKKDLEKRVSSGHKKWKNEIQYARLNLVTSGDLEKSRIRGVWEISEKGRKRIQP